jgi:MFS family permease
MLGWSLIEGLGAVLVIPSVAALIAVNYKGKERVIAYAIIGGIGGAAAAAGPLIGGFMTTYVSWRYIFIAETVIMVAILIFSRSFKHVAPTTKDPIDLPSAFLSAIGMLLIVFGMLQSKVWGWITPIEVPSINGYSISPFGISIVSYMILAGAILLWIFYNRQESLEKAGKNPLIQVSMLKVRQLRSGLGVLLAQLIITGSIFFVVPIYLQMIFKLDALQTGIKILPLSVALIIFSLVGARLVSKKSPKFVVKLGQILLTTGSVFLLAAVNENLTGIPFALAMFCLGAGLGLLASQLGNVNMSAVSEEKSSEVGGLQGTFQNLGSSLGTALIGSIMVASLTTGFL